MALAFLIGAAALFTLSQIGGTNPVMFVLVTALYFGVYGEIFSLFPATQGDTFGSEVRGGQRRHAVHRQGRRCAARALRRRHRQGSRLRRDIHPVRCTFNIIAALLALFVLEAHASAALRQKSRRHRPMAG